MKKKAILKKPNIFAYTIFHYGCKIFAKLKYNLKIVRNELKGVKTPYVLLANHESGIDVVTLSGAIRRKAHFVMSNSFYHTLGMRWALDACGLIPKQQFQTNGTDMKKMKAAVATNKLGLVLYPDGLMSENGESTPMPKSTGRVVRWFNQDVYIAKVEGSYLTKPKWSKNLRKGKVTLSIYKLFDAEILKTMNDDDIQEAIEKELYFNAYENQERNKIIYRNGDNIEGLQTVLYQCPKCGKKHVMIIENKNTIKCKECGYGLVADKYGFLNPLNDNDICYRYPLTWSNKIYDDLAKEIEENDEYMLSSKVKIQMISYKKQKYEDVGEGYLTLDKDKFHLTGTAREKEIDIHFNVESFPIVPFKPGVNFDLQDNNDIYRMILENPSHTMEWVNTLKFFHNKKVKNEIKQIIIE